MFNFTKNKTLIINEKNAISFSSRYYEYSSQILIEKTHFQHLFVNIYREHLTWIFNANIEREYSQWTFIDNFHFQHLNEYLSRTFNANFQREHSTRTFSMNIRRDHFFIKVFRVTFDAKFFFVISTTTRWEEIKSRKSQKNAKWKKKRENVMNLSNVKTIEFISIFAKCFRICI